MANLSVNIAGVEFHNPVILASGCCGFGREYDAFFPPSAVGGMSLKGTTLEPRLGNALPRIAETPMGTLNSVGLQNPGVHSFVKDALPQILGRGTRVIANISGSTIEDYVESCRIVNESDIDMVELNISCPNVKHGGAAFGVDCTMAHEVVSHCRKALTKKPMMVKLSPNVTDITAVALAVQDAGADAVALINTLLGMRIDISTGRPILKNNVGGLSGPAVFPVALRMVWQVAGKVKIPVVGLGGISTGEEAIEMMMAGASAVQVGVAMFADPFAPVKIVDGINSWLDKNNINDVNKIVGTVKPW